jgi:hypothetical protein
LPALSAARPRMAVPGFVGGVLFSIVLGMAWRHRRLDELSLPRVAAWGLWAYQLWVTPRSLALSRSSAVALRSKRAS